MVLTGMAALAQMELAIERERDNDSGEETACRREGPGRRRWQQFRHSQIQNARRLVDGGEQATRIAKDLGMSPATLYRRIHELS
jgi:DNA invertase Pin-like site-specific DNA recombinase